LAFSIASAPVDKITALLVRVTRPAFAAVQDRPTDVKRMFLNVSAALAFVTVPASVGLAVLSRDLVTALFGNKWAEAALPLALLSVCTPMRSLAPLLPQILVAVGESRFAMRINLVAAVVMPLSFLVGSVLGLPGVAAVWVLVYPALTLPSAWRVSRRINLTLGEYVAATGPAILGASLMGVGVLVARWGLPPAWPAAARLTLLVPLGVAIFFSVMFTVFRSRTKSYLSAFRALRET
jgi:O-antigen/teichoic acid export membrane protein